VLLIEPSSPVVSLTTPASSVVNIGSMFSLSATVTFDSGNSAYCQWTSSDTALNLYNVSLVYPLIKYTADSSATAMAANLVLSANTLPARSTLSFMLACYVVGSSGVAAQASISIATLAPPILGSFSVSPSTGTEISTLFALTAANWYDEYIPLQYSFGFVDVQYGRMTVIRPRSYVTYGSTQLSAGSSSSNYSLSCFVSVFNTYLVNATVYETVQVLEMETTSASTIMESISVAITASESSPVSLTQIVTLYSPVLNRVDCSLAPNCTQLHRSSCSTTANTCGACLSTSSVAYVGLDGDSNQPCMLLTDLLSQDGTCEEDADCSPYGSCNITSGECVVTSQECSDSVTCNGHGQYYYEDTSSGSVLTECLSGSISCAVACTCEEPYVGPYCNQTAAEVASARSSRALLVSSLSTLLTVQDADSDTLSSWATSLVVSTQSSAELSPSTALVAMDVCDSIVSQASGYSSSFASSSVSLIAGALDNIAASRSVNSDVGSNVTTRVAASITAVTQLLTSSMLPGQSSMSLTQSTFRVNSIVATADAVVSLASPRSTSEVAFNMKYSSVDISQGSTTSGTSSGSFSLVMLKSSLFVEVVNVSAAGANKTSAPGRLLFDSESLCSRGSLEYDFTFTLAHIEEQVYGNGTAIALALSQDSEDSAVVGECFSGQKGNFTVDCPSTSLVRNVSYYCDGIWDYNLTVKCPRSIQYRAASCSATLNGYELEAGACAVVNSSSWYTQCGCRVCDSTTRTLVAMSADGRRLTMSGQAAADVVATSVVMSAEEFVSVLSNPSALSTVSDVLYVIRVVIVFVALWLGLPALWGCSVLLKRTRFKKEAKHSRRRASVGNYMNAPSKTNASKVLVDYALSILPGMFSGENVFVRCFDEISEKVPFFIILSGSSEKFKNYQFPIILFKLLTLLTFGLFALSFFFTLQYPADDGSCGTFSEEVTCLSEKSVFDKSTNKCHWSNNTFVHPDSVTTYDPQCTMAQPVFNAYMNVVMCVLVTLATMPCLFILERLFSEILLAPTAAELDGPTGTEILPLKAVNKAVAVVNKAAGAAAGAVRRASVNIATQVAEAAAVVNKQRRHTYRVMEENIVLPPEIIKTRFTAVQVCSEIPAFKAIANEIKINMSREAPTVHQDDDDENATSSIRKKLRSSFRTISRSKESPDVPPDNGSAQHRHGMTHHGATSRAHLQAERDWKQLMQDLKECREQLEREEDLEAFDNAWGIDSVNKGQIVLSQGSRDVLRKEYMVARTRGTRTLTALKQMPRSMCGAELMKLFFVDMIGTTSTSSKILASNVSDSVLNKKRVVTWGMKCSVIAGLIVVNLFFIYTCLLYAANRSRGWQVSWVVNAVINVAIEMICGPLLECFVLDCLIPGSISPLVSSAKSEINRQVTRLCDQTSAKSTYRNFPDLMSKYFFASRVVANRRPDLVESTLIHGFEASFPFINAHLRHKIHDRRMWHHNQQQQENQSLALRLTTGSWMVSSVGLTMLLTTTLRQLGTLPIPVQKFTMQLTQPLFIGGFGFAFSYLQRSAGLAWAVLVITLIALCLGALLAYTLYALFRVPSPDGSMAVMPVFTEEPKLSPRSAALAGTSTPDDGKSVVTPSPNKYKTGNELSRSGASTSQRSGAGGGQQFHSVAGSSASKGSSTSRDENPRQISMSGRGARNLIESWSNHTYNNTEDDEIHLHGEELDAEDGDEDQDVDSMESWLDSGSIYSEASNADADDDGNIDWDNISDYNYDAGRQSVINQITGQGPQMPNVGSPPAPALSGRVAEKNRKVEDDHAVGVDSDDEETRSEVYDLDGFSDILFDDDDENDKSPASGYPDKSSGNVPRRDNDDDNSHAGRSDTCNNAGSVREEDESEIDFDHDFDRNGAKPKPQSAESIHIDLTSGTRPVGNVKEAADESDVDLGDAFADFEDDIDGDVWNDSSDL
jgi:hypothetical protein